jgi:FtsZ-binding cell division protein ZapB
LDRLTLDRLFIIAFLFSSFGIIIALDATIQRLKIDEKELLEKNKLRQEINELRQEISSLKKLPDSLVF